MPQYYTGSNSDSAFASGMMAGYEFIDRIKARKEQIELEKRQQERLDEQLALQKTGFEEDMTDRRTNRARSATQFERETETYQHALARRPKVESLEDEYRETGISANKAQIRASGLSADKSEYELGQAKEREARQDAYSSVLQRSQPEPLTLGGIGGGYDETGQPVPRASAPLSAGGLDPAVLEPRYPNAVKPTAPPKSLEDQQRDIEKGAPLLVQKAGEVLDAVGGAGNKLLANIGELADRGHGEQAREVWKDVAHPELNRTSLVGGFIRGDLARSAPGYMRDRKLLDPEDRAILDANMEGALQKKADALTAQLEKAPPQKRAALQRDVDDVQRRQLALREARVLTAAVDAGITAKVTTANDPNASRLVQQAVQSQLPSGSVSERTEAKDRLQRTRVQRINPNNMSQKDWAVISDMFAHGDIDAKTFENWRQYGTPLAPQQARYLPVGGGAILKVTADGREEWLTTGGTGKKDSTAQAQSVARGMAEFSKLMNDSIKQGLVPGAEKDTGSLQAHRVIELLEANASAFQRETGIKVIDADGNLDVTFLEDPTKRNKAQRWFVNVVTGGDSPDETPYAIPNAERAAELVPQRPKVEVSNSSQSGGPKRRYKTGERMGEYIYAGQEDGFGEYRDEWVTIDEWARKVGGAR